MEQHACCKGSTVRFLFEINAALLKEVRSFVLRCVKAFETPSHVSQSASSWMACVQGCLCADSLFLSCKGFQVPACGHSANYLCKQAIPPPTIFPVRGKPTGLKSSPYMPSTYPLTFFLHSTVIKPLFPTRHHLRPIPAGISASHTKAGHVLLHWSTNTSAPKHFYLRNEVKNES